MGNIGSHVDLTSGWPGHQADIEADGASRSENWSDGDFAPAMPHPPLTATQVSIDSTARRPVATTTSAVASRLHRTDPRPLRKTAVVPETEKNPRYQKNPHYP